MRLLIVKYFLCGPFWLYQANPGLWQWSWYSGWWTGLKFYTSWTSWSKVIVIESSMVFKLFGICGNMGPDLWWKSVFITYNFCDLRSLLQTLQRQAWMHSVMCPMHNQYETTKGLGKFYTVMMKMLVRRPNIVNKICPVLLNLLFKTHACICYW